MSNTNFYHYGGLPHVYWNEYKGLEILLASRSYVKHTLHVAITNKLKSIRLKQEINQTEMAKACDVSRQTIHSIEVAKYTPSVELALKIAKVLNLSVEQVFKIKGESNER